jgi:hypothetical protein
MDKRLLVFDCHEAWVHQLRALPQPLDIVIGLRGRHTAGWDKSMRPVPPNARLVRLEEAVRAAESYDCIIAHNLTDLLDAKALRGPRLLILHETLAGAMLEQGSTIPADELRRAVIKFTQLTSTQVAAVSKLKGKSWGFDEDLVTLSADPEDYPAWRGDLAHGLRVANHIERRPRILMWDFHCQAFGGLPITLVGHNPGMDGVKTSADWAELKQIFNRHRFYIHTADPHLEDGYNMATLEAMASGLPVLGNRHPTSPIEHRVNGFLSDDPAELGRYAAQLLADRELAARMGAAARETVAKHYSPSRFAAAVADSIQRARRMWERERANALSCR